MLAHHTAGAEIAGMHQAKARHRDTIAHHRRKHTMGDMHGAEIAKPAVIADTYSFAVGAQGRELTEMAARTDGGATNHSSVSRCLYIAGEARAEIEIGNDDHRERAPKLLGWTETSIHRRNHGRGSPSSFCCMSRNTSRFSITRRALKSVRGKLWDATISICARTAKVFNKR